ncbi:MAG TPA: tetratricopeptide repeat protein [Pirellulales bacterium]
MLGSFRVRGASPFGESGASRGASRFVVGGLIATGLLCAGLIVAALAFSALFTARVSPLPTASAREPIGTGLDEEFENLFETDAPLFDSAPASETPSNGTAESETAEVVAAPAAFPKVQLPSSLRETLKRRARTSPPEPLPAPLSREDSGVVRTEQNAASQVAEVAAPSEQPPHDPFQKSLAETPATGSEVGTIIRVAGTSEERPIRTLAAGVTTSDRVEPDPASLQGVKPGTTTTADLDRLWAPPREVENVDGVERRVYALAPFERVEVDVANNVVLTILVNLKDAASAEALARDLGLGFIEPISIDDEAGTPLGEAYPERGVLFTYDPGGNPEAPLVRQIVLEPIQAEPFILRAESRMEHDYRQARGDLDQALALSPGDVRALWLKARVLCAAGACDEALAALDPALQQAPQEPMYLLTRAEILERRGEYEAAAIAAREADRLAPEGSPLKAKAALREADILAGGPRHDFKTAMQRRSDAMKIAQTMVAETQPPMVQAVGYELLFEVYLGTANDIAWGKWKGKDQVVPRWLEKAVELIDPDQDDPPVMQFRLGCVALQAYVGMQQPLPDADFGNGVCECGESLLEQTQDPIRRSQLAWDLGKALHDAMQIHLANKEYEPALIYGTKAVHYLEQGYPDQRQSPGAGYLVGRAYFRMGSIYALWKQDYAQAVAWYDRALPLLDQPAPQSVLADVGRQGESFVSMGVSYWKNGQHPQALRITSKGMEMMREAVDARLLRPIDLSVAYRNLSNMHRALGNAKDSEEFGRLAAEAQGTTAQRVE